MGRRPDRGPRPGATASGAIYEGDFKAGKPDGTGRIVHPDGGAYAGEWVAGRMQGQGVATFPDGGRYEGAFNEGRQEGAGLYVADGARREEPG